MRLITLASVLIVSVTLGTSGAVSAPRPDLSSDVANTLTHIGISVPVLTTTSLVVFGNDEQEQVGRQAGDALLATGAATLLVKEITNQSRPDDPNAEDGFPSGHASMNFAFARCVAQEYEDWGNLAYLWAAGVSWSRVRRDDHSVAQVIAGAALGWWVADRSIHSDGGLLTGLIVKETPMALSSRPIATEKLSTARLNVWQASW